MSLTTKGAARYRRESMRSAEEIVKYIEKNKDPFGVVLDELVPFLPYEHAKSYLNEGVTCAHWERDNCYTKEGVLRDAEEYMEFAWEKAGNHKGLSARRSLIKMLAWMFLLERDDIVEAMDQAGFVNFGAPMLAAVCEAMYWPIPDDEEIRRMIAGKPCVPRCDRGCA
jgi:hypothetical protein